MQSEASVFLARLAAELRSRGWVTELRSDGRLVVTNPLDAGMREVIGCRQRDGGWEFRWSWDASLGPVNDVEAAADRITHVLRTVGPEVGPEDGEQ
jgi:homospermidine synthase